MKGEFKYLLLNIDNMENKKYLIILTTIIIGYIIFIKIDNLINVYNSKKIIENVLGERLNFKYKEQQICRTTSEPFTIVVDNCNIYVFRNNHSNSNTYIINKNNEYILYNKQIHEINTNTIKKYIEKYFPDNIYLDYNLYDVENIDPEENLYDELNKGHTWPVSVTLKLNQSTKQLFEEKIIEKLYSLKEEISNEKNMYVHYSLEITTSSGGIIEQDSDKDYISYNLRSSAAKTTEEFLKSINKK